MYVQNQHALVTSTFLEKSVANRLGVVLILFGAMMLMLMKISANNTSNAFWVVLSKKSKQRHKKL